MDRADPRADLRKRNLLEVSVFLILIVPSMIISFFASESISLGFPIMAFSVIFRDIALAGLILFFLWRNGEPRSLIGWKFTRLRDEVAWGAGLFLPVMVAEWFIERGFQNLGLSSTMNRLPHFLTARGPEEIVLACVLVTVVAVTEETIFRGYLIARFNDLTAGTAVSVIVSSAVFALGHGYEGPASVGTIGVLGAILAVIYLWRKSLIAPMVIHFLIDFYPLVLMPLVRLK